MDSIYLDNAATTPLLPAVWEAMRPHALDAFANPASAHRPGARARKALEDARERSAALLGADPDEVVFTSGATEANNLAVTGLTGQAPGHVLVSPVEHPSVVEPVARLAAAGFSAEHLAVRADGRIPADALAGRVRGDTVLVAVQCANHETGALQPVAELAADVAGRTAFHCDATQAVGKIPIGFHELGVSTLALSAHKFHGPKGVGALLVRRGTRLRPLLAGGHQQRGRRPGTEPVALAVGLATALDLWHQQADERLRKVRRLRRLLLDQLELSAAPVIVNGPDAEQPHHALPHTLNISFPGCQADALFMRLDLAGVACSTGSACSSGSLLPSPVLRAMALPAERVGSAIRFSLSPLLSENEIADAARRIVQAVTALRGFPAAVNCVS